MARHLLTGANVGWLALLLVLTGAEHVWALAGTGIILTANLAMALMALIQEKRLLILLNALQILLFSTLYYQVFTCLGPHHYQVDPGWKWFDWIDFSLLHALRAGDLLSLAGHDFFSGRLIRPASNLSRMLLVAMNFQAALFLLGFLIRIFMKSWRRITGAPDATY